MNTYGYDANGNQRKVSTSIEDDGYLYPAYTVTRLFDNENRLTEVNNLDEHTNQTDNSKFYYNGDGQLMKVIRTVTGDYAFKASKYFFYDGDQVIADLDGANAVIASYTRTGGGQLLSTYNLGDELKVHGSGRETFYVFCDRLGTVMGVYGKDSAKANQIRYDSHGFHNGLDDAMRFPFTGAPYFSEVGLYQMGARYYNPDIGRFITRDTYRGDIYKPWTQNLYTYCNNNPVNYVDPTGHWAETVLDAASIAWSAIELWNDPSWKNLGLLAWDVGATVVPFAPGSYVAKPGRLFGKADEVVSALKRMNIDEKTEAIRDGKVMMAYKKLKPLKEFTGLNAHHIIEARFADKLGIDSGDIISAAIDPETHYKITAKMREKIPYRNSVQGILKKNTDTAELTDIWKATRETYEELGLLQYIDPAKDMFKKAGLNIK